MENHFILNRLRSTCTALFLLAFADFTHCARHTFATLQLAMGTDIYTVSRMLTHKNISTTQIYLSMVDSKKREAGNKISLKENKK